MRAMGPVAPSCARGAVSRIRREHASTAGMALRFMLTPHPRKIRTRDETGLAADSVDQNPTWKQGLTRTIVRVESGPGIVIDSLTRQVSASSVEGADRSFQSATRRPCTH